MRTLPVWILALLVGACGRDRAEREVTIPVPPVKTRDATARNAVYLCGDLEVSAEFPDDDTARITLEERSLTLKRVYSASGVKYADDAGNEFWTKDGAMLTLAGQPMRRCTRHEGID